MNYSEMSDFDINCSVAKSLGLKDFGIGLFADELRVYQVGELAGDKFPFDPCNSWADAGPIIEENEIALVKCPNGWCATSDYSHLDGLYHVNKSPTRAAMIAFLMMKDEEAKNESH